ncbi:MAG: response regulator transcription factor, partial [Chloroflexota bacterium]|nr:response regulator transcription factor [Chloroflexota bacterium]
MACQSEVTAKILLLEKGVSAANSLSSSLGKEGYSVLFARDEDEAIKWMSSGEPDLLILDISTFASGHAQIGKSLRREIERLPSLLILAGGSDTEIEIDVDGCLTRPLTPKQLSNQIERILQAWGKKLLRVGELTLNLKTRRVFHGKRACKLSPKQFALLRTFMAHSGRVLSHKFLMKKVWNTDYVGDTGTLYVHMRLLREKIEDNPNSPVYLHTIRGKGYCFDAPGRTSGEKD